MNVEPVRNDPDAGTTVGKLAQIFSRAGNHRRGFEQFALGHREPVQAVVLLIVFYAPLAQAVRHVGRELFDVALQPFRRDLAHAAEKVGAHAVQVYANDQALQRCSFHNMPLVYLLPGHPMRQVSMRISCSSRQTTTPTLFVKPIYTSRDGENTLMARFGRESP